MKKINEKKLRDTAYKIATGNHLVKSFTYAQFQRCNTMKYVWQMVEDWDEGELNCHITQLAEQIYQALKDTANGTME